MVRVGVVLRRTQLWVVADVLTTCVEVIFRVNVRSGVGQSLV